MVRMLFLVFFAFSCISYGETASSSDEDYMAIFMNDQKVGYASNSRVLVGDKVSTTEKTVITMSRGNASVAIDMCKVYNETADGKPIGFKSIQKISNMTQQVEGTVNGHVIDLTIDMGMGKQSQQVPWPKGAMMPEALRQLSIKKGLKAGTSYKAKIFDSDMMGAIDAQIAVKDRQKVQLLGTIAELSEVETIMMMPTGSVDMAAYVDDNHDVRKLKMNLMGVELEMVSCSKEFAMGGNSKADLFTAMFLKSPRDLGDVSQYSSLEYTLKVIDDYDVKIPSDDSQTVHVKDKDIVVKVEPLKSMSASEIPYQGNDSDVKQYLEPTEFIQSDNELIKSLALKAVGNEKDAFKAAKRIEAFVDNYIQKKNISILYASAAEVAQSRAGDCSEHAVLAAAMCRAVGIPARIAVGIVYAEGFAAQKNIFGGHAWTEVYVGGKWFGIDATRSSLGYSAGHIKLAQGNGRPADLLGILNNLGHFKILEIKN